VVGMGVFNQFQPEKDGDSPEKDGDSPEKDEDVS